MLGKLTGLLEFSIPWERAGDLGVNLAIKKGWERMWVKLVRGVFWANGQMSTKPKDTESWLQISKANGNRWLPQRKRTCPRCWIRPPKVYVVSCQKGKRYPGLSMLERYGRHYWILTPFADSLSSIKNQFASIFFLPKGQSDVSKVICPQSGADRRHRFLKGRVK